MIEQIFSFSDIPRLFVLTFLELLLSADNALVLGVLVQPLPPLLRRKALYIGIASAFIFRLIALFAVLTLFELVWIQLLASAYLLYLSLRYFTKKKKSINPKPAPSFWRIVLLIETLDFLFAIDSIVAGVALIDGAFSKLWVVYLGGLLGIVGVRYAATLFSSLLCRFPNLEKSAYLMVGWVGLKLGLSALHLQIPSPLFVSVTVFFFLLGFFRAKQ